jgi:hypothetical protein
VLEVVENLSMIRIWVGLYPEASSPKNSGAVGREGARHASRKRHFAQSRDVHSARIPVILNREYLGTQVSRILLVRKNYAVAELKRGTDALIS